MKTVFLVDDDSDLLNMLAAYFRKAGYAVTQEANSRKALNRLADESFDVVITDLIMDEVDGMEILDTIKKSGSKTEVIIITGNSSVDTAVRAMKQGAFEYITKPVDMEELFLVVQKACERQELLSQVQRLKREVKHFNHPDNIIATSQSMKRLMETVKKIADSDATVLIEGESGTGKEVIAKAIHHFGVRSEASFVAINCAAMPENLLESELFGHVKGAFTGANKMKKGLFEEAHRGTIFLDEIGETGSAFQVKLLRVLQENEIRRVGDTNAVPVDVRVLASSNTPLRTLVSEGRFREDLYYRLRVIPLRIPSIRERREDILPLARFFIDRFCEKNKQQRVPLSRTAVEMLESYDWPGNVRELENTIERAMILVNGDMICEDDILIEQHASHPSYSNQARLSLKEMERQHIRSVLDACGGNKAEAARILGIGYNTLWRKLKECNADRLVLEGS